MQVRSAGSAGGARCHGPAVRVGGGRGTARRAGMAEPLGGARRGGPGAGGAVGARPRDRRRDRGPAGRAPGAGAALARRVPVRRDRGAALAPAAGPDATEARGGARGGRRPAGQAGGRPAAPDLGPAGAGGRGAHRRDDLPRAPERGAAKGGYRWRRPRHTLKGRQDANAVDYAGLRLRLLKQQAAAGDIHLLFGDEAEALTHPYLAHAWAARGADLRIAAPGQARKRALLGVLDHARGELVVLTSGTERSGDFLALLGRLDRDYAPRPGRTDRPVVLVLDNGPIHTSRAARKALAARPWPTAPSAAPMTSTPPSTVPSRPSTVNAKPQRAPSFPKLLRLGEALAAAE